MRKGSRHILPIALSSLVCMAATMYVPHEVAQVPIARLSANLRRAIRQAPGNTMYLTNLARAHAMAWSQQSDSVPVSVGMQLPRPLGGQSPPKPKVNYDDVNQAYFGPNPGAVPFAYQSPREANDPARRRRAAAHLDTALSLYAQALTINPADRVSRLGRAWLLAQTSRRDSAVAELRTLVRIQPSADATRDPYPGWNVSTEAARYLIPLLSNSRDAAEIRALTAVINAPVRESRMVTPIVVPVIDSARPADLEDRAAAISFDADGSGRGTRWSWITSNAAWLVYDPTRSGRVTSALQLFGSVSFWMFWKNGYDALAALDNKGDGILRGSELDGLALWRDMNRDGVSDPGEVRPVGDWGIVALSCLSSVDARHPDHIAFAAAGVQFRDGRIRPTYDLMLHARTIVATGR